MRALAIGGLGLVGLFAGVAVGILVDRVPARLPLLPLRDARRRCRSVAPPPLAIGTAAEDASSTDPALGERSVLEYDDGGHGAPALTLPLLRRRCPVCHRPAGIRYAVVELVSAVLFASAAWRLGADWALPAYMVFFACLVAVSAIDLEHHIIPNRIVYPTIFASVPLLAAAAALQGEGDRLEHALIGATAAWGALLLIYLVSPRGMGFGDVRLSFVLGLYLGWMGLRHVLTGIFMGFLLGSVVGLGLVAIRLRTRKDHIPFGPFLAAGAVVTVLGGATINRWWLTG